MKFMATNTEVLKSSLQFSEDGQTITFMSNTNVRVEGNTYNDLFTTKTVTGMSIATNNVININEVAQIQAQEWVDENYPQI